MQHAHQRAIIHRDLKPSNILVTEVDGKPVPKIIDFGVAKAMSQRLTDETLFTRAGAILGTPEYMSPEQADSAGDGLDTRSDVYSLGVVLYELLVGVLPLELRELSFEEMLRRLRRGKHPSAEHESAHVRRTVDYQRAEPPHRTRDVEAPTAQRSGCDHVESSGERTGTPLRDSVGVGRRYRRHLRNEPVVARPASIGYRGRKYIRRHRLGVAVATGLFLLLASFAIVQGIQLRRITRERDRADRITNFMTGMFKVSNPSEARGNKVTAREILDKASKDIGTGLANDPELQAQMMNVMGTVYFNLGLYSQAHPLLSRAVEIRTRILGPEHPDTLKTMNNLATTLDDEGRYAEAERLHRQVLGIRRRTLGPDHADTLVSINNLANSLGEQGRYAEAEKLMRQGVEIENRVLGPEHNLTIGAKENLAITLDQEGKYAEAEKLEREVLNIRRRVAGAEHQDTVRSMSNLGATLTHRGKYGEAEKVEREALDIQRRILGREHPDTAATIYNLACIAAHQGRRGEALSLLREALDDHLDVETMLGMEKEPELKSLQGDPRFEALIERAGQLTAAATKSQ